jgi:hypothetical protein
MIAQRVLSVLFITLAAGGILDRGPLRQDARPAFALLDTPPASPLQVAGYCCDESGVRHCVLLNPTPVGYPCVCEGPGGGWGWACQ